MLKLFIKECLFFRSNEIMNRIFGTMGWLSIAMLLYAIAMLLLALLGHNVPSLIS